MPPSPQKKHHDGPTPSSPARSGFEATLNTKQRHALEILQQRMANSEFAADVEQNPDGDRFLLRFLRATMHDKHNDRIFQVDKAEERLISTLEWRRRYKIDDIRRTLETGGPLPDGYDVYLEQVRPRHIFIDPETGRPVHMERLGLFSQHVKVDRFTREQWITYVAVDTEKMLKTLREESAKRHIEISTTIVLMNFEGGGFGLMRRMGLFQALNEVAAQHYPEMVGKIIVTNTPRVFSQLWAFARTFIDADTVSKIEIVSGPGTQVIARTLSLDLVPKEFGGLSDVVLPIPLDAR